MCWSLFLILSIAKNFKSIYFEKHLRMATSENLSISCCFFNLTWKNKLFQHQCQKQVNMFVVSWLVSHEVCIYIQYFFGVVRNKHQTLNIKIKRRSKVQEKNISCERALILTNEKYFPKTISQWEVDCGLFTNLTRIIVTRDFSPSSFKLKRGILPLLTKYVS